MKRRDVFRVLAGVASVAIGTTLLSGCGLIEPQASFRFRMTVEADTPQGPRSGSGVMEITAQKLVKMSAQEAAGSIGITGQAVVVDLPGGPVFVLVTGQKDMWEQVLQAFKPGQETGGVINYLPLVREIAAAGTGELKADLPRERTDPVTGETVPNWPVLVRFRDIHDPKSVELVDPASVGIKRIHLETTRDPVTTGIEKRIPKPPYVRWFAYQGEESEALNLHKGKRVSEVIGVNNFDSGHYK